MEVEASDWQRRAMSEVRKQADKRNWDYVIECAARADMCERVMKVLDDATLGGDESDDTT